MLEQFTALADAFVRAAVGAQARLKDRTSILRFSALMSRFQGVIDDYEGALKRAVVESAPEGSEVEELSASESLRFFRCRNPHIVFFDPEPGLY